VTRARRLRALAVWGALAIGVAGAVVWRAAAVRDAMGKSVNATHALTVRTLLLQAGAWGGARAAHAETLAALLAEDLAGDAPARVAVGARLAAAMAVLARRDAFVGGRVHDGAGVVVARAGTGGDQEADVAHAEVVPGGGSPALAASSPSGASVRTLAVRCGVGFCAEFHAAMHAGGRRLGTVVLVAPVDDSTFQPLNASRADIRTLRTTVLAPLADSPADGHADGGGLGRTLAVMASVGAPDSPEPPAQLAAAELPSHVRRALDGPPGRLAIDTAAGLHGATTHYAVVRVPGLDWLLLREFDRSEVLDAARGALLIEVPILGTLFVSLVALGRNRLHVRRTRRERELTRLRADFVASTSHELRTPLAQIRLFAELLQKGALRGPEESARALRIIEKEASRLTILVDNLLHYTRLRRRAEDAAAGGDASVEATSEVAAEVAHVVEAFAPLAAERGTQVTCAVPDGLHARVDSLALRQVLINYLENAVKYGPPRQTITVSASAHGPRVRLWVDDQGAGVPRDERALIWEPFRRGRVAESSAHGGSGIGLAVVRELALQYGGDAGVEDAPGGGARFVVCFPSADRRAGEHLDQRPGR
jgi:signal transduction histidine kinase